MGAMNLNGKEYLPSPLIRNSIIVIVVLALVAGGIAWAYPYIKEKKEARAVQKQSVLIKESSGDLDSDGDSIPDWEEILYGLDPKKQDTDGDGVADGEVIAAFKAQADNQSKLALDLKSVPETTRLGLTLAGQIEHDNTLGIIDNQTTFSNIYLTTDQSLTAKEQSYKPYTTDSFPMKILDNPSEIESYIASMERLLGPLSKTIISSGIFSTAEAKYGTNATDTSPLDPSLGAKLDGIINQLGGTLVPTPMSDIHLAFMNSLATISAIAKKTPPPDITERATDLALLQKALLAFADAYDTMVSYKSFF
jgi:hypothetical protein